MKWTILAIALYGLVYIGCVAQSHNRYDTALLSEMARKMGITSKLDTLGNGVHRDFCNHKDKQVTVIVANGEVQHIGYTVFSLEQRKAMASPIYNFIERYALEMDLPRQSTFSVAKQLEMDGVVFTCGTLSMLPRLAHDTTLSVGISQHEERAYTVEWRCGNDVVCKMFFPASYTLMHGSKMIENEGKLSSLIRAYKPVAEKTAAVSMDEVVKADSLQGDYYILRRGYNSIHAMVGDRYYNKVKDSQGNESLTLLCSKDYPVETVTNLFSTTELANDYTVNVRLRKYNFESETFTVKLSQLVGYFTTKEQCKAYFGVISYNPHTNQLTALVEMRNRELAYEHLLRVTMDTSTLAQMKGEINVTLTSYIQTHKIISLYAEDE